MDAEIDVAAMLARLQQIIVVALGLAVVAWMATGWLLGWHWGWVAAGAITLLFAHAWILAVEFALLRGVDPGASIPRPNARQLAAAWWGEIWAGARVFGWRQPFMSERHPDHHRSDLVTGRRGVVLVHGFVCNRGLWNPWMTRLRAGGVPHVAVNLEPVFGRIDRYVPAIEQAVASLHAATGQPPLVVAHSMGGLAVRAWMRDRQADHRVHSIITIGTPHHGTWLARFALAPNTRQMRRHSDWLTQLAADEPPSRRARFTCFYGHCDNIVFPASTAMLPEADNRHVPGVAHVALAFRDEVWREVWRRVDPRARVE